MIRQEMKRSFWSCHGFKNLFVWLFLYLVIVPFLKQVPYAQIVSKLFLSTALFSAAYTIDKESKILWISIFLLSVTLVVFWVNTIGAIKFSPETINLLLILYLSTLIYSFGYFLFTSRYITWNVLCSALCLYMIIGLLWGHIFTLIESLTPGSFVGVLINNTSNFEEKAHYLKYFSFTTLTTLGYGDITPKTWVATTLCQAEAIIGQLFTVVLVARLVGIHIVQEFGNNE